MRPGLSARQVAKDLHQTDRRSTREPGTLWDKECWSEVGTPAGEPQAHFLDCVPAGLGEPAPRLPLAHSPSSPLCRAPGGSLAAPRAPKPSSRARVGMTPGRGQAREWRHLVSQPEWPSAQLGFGGG